MLLKHKSKKNREKDENLSTLDKHKELIVNHYCI